MRAAAEGSPMSAEFLTWAEIEKKYPNEWVLIDRPKSRRGSLEVVGGYVVFHTPDRDELDRRLGEFEHVTASNSSPTTCPRR
jgi:hypothetical protein